MPGIPSGKRQQRIRPAADKADGRRITPLDGVFAGLGEGIRRVRFLLIITKIATLFSPFRVFLPVSLFFFLGGLGNYATPITRKIASPICRCLR